MKNPFQIVKEFEEALCEYTGSLYCATTTSCTMALLLACAYQKQKHYADVATDVTLPRHTYVGVPMSVIHAGFGVHFNERANDAWVGAYQLRPLPIWDSARWFTSGMFHKFPNKGELMVCVSFHWSKTLGIEQGGAILHNIPYADTWLRRARFDGRAEGVEPAKDHFDMLGWHAYMSPETAARGLMRLAQLPLHNDPLPTSDYPDLSKFPVFRGRK